MSKNKKKIPVKKNFPVWGWALLAALVIIVAAVVYQVSRPQSVSFPSEVSVTEAAQKQQEGAFMLDVREPDEWRQGHIDGAVLIPLGELPQRLSEVPQDAEVVVVCRSGNRSAKGRDILLDAGYPTVTSMAGGMTAWQSQGLPVVTGD